MKTHCLQHKDLVIAWVRIILALGTNHLNFGYESSGYETSVGTKRSVSEYVHRGQTYFTASHSQVCYFCYFLISRRDGEKMASLQVFPSSLLPRTWSRALIPFPFPFERPPRGLSSMLVHYIEAMLSFNF